MPEDFSRLPIEAKAKFVELSGRLSPENLSCDGELSRTKIQQRYQAIMAEWRELEKKHGVTVIEDQAWGFLTEVATWQKRCRAEEMAKEPQHPLLKHVNPGTWTREGANGMTAYYIWGGPGRDMDLFEVYSEFGSLLFRRERLNQYPTLEEAVEVAERFMAGITLKRMRQFLPAYYDDNLLRAIKRLPLEHLDRQGITV